VDGVDAPCSNACMNAEPVPCLSPIPTCLPLTCDVGSCLCLQWVAPARCQLPLPLLRALFNVVAPAIRTASAPQLQRCLAAAAALHSRGEMPPDK
jgi:hypothetical protein